MRHTIEIVMRVALLLSPSSSPQGGKIRLAIARKRELLLYEWRERSRSFAVIKELAIPDRFA